MKTKILLGICLIFIVIFMACNFVLAEENGEKNFLPEQNETPSLPSLPSLPGIDPQVLQNLLNAPTGKMNDKIWLELFTKLVCDEKKSLTGEEWEAALKPFGVSGLEFAAYHWQLFMTRLDSPEMEKLLEKGKKRLEEMRKNNCQIEVPEENGEDDSLINKCEDADALDAYKKGEVLFYGRQATTTEAAIWCNPCKYEDECVDGVIYERYCLNNRPAEKKIKCPYGCYNGYCLTKEQAESQICPGICLEKKCPFGTLSIGKQGCPVGNCKVVQGQEECESVARCCLILDKSKIGPETCPGVCLADLSCPQGFEILETESCASSEECYKCGWLNLFTCCDYIPKICCQPKETGTLLPQPSPCEGICVTGEICATDFTASGRADCQLAKKCEKCGLFGLKKCCQYLRATCCVPQKQDLICRGFCTRGECGGGYKNIGLSNCGQEKVCHKCGFLNLFKCCEKIATHCCQPGKPVNVCSGICSLECPGETSNVGQANCGTQKVCRKCGIFKLFTCCEQKQTYCCQ